MEPLEKLQPRVESVPRTDAWCTEECEQEATIQNIMNRVMDFTGIPMENSEYLEILEYPSGGRFEEHHDLIETQGKERCGNRILTVYFFLSDVDEGGEIVFHDLNDRTILPKKGRVVIFNNVLADDLDAMQEYSFHEFMPIKSGTAYGAHWWLHPRNLRDPLKEDCCM